jgi:hypothetical protein
MSNSSYNKEEGRGRTRRGIRQRCPSARLHQLTLTSTTATTAPLPPTLPKFVVTSSTVRLSQSRDYHIRTYFSLDRITGDSSREGSNEREAVGDLSTCRAMDPSFNLLRLTGESSNAANLFGAS